jgi:autotransporter-associated beta strand protein
VGQLCHDRCRHLGGVRKITATDGGWVTFAGADNSYSGLLDIRRDAICASATARISVGRPRHLRGQRHARAQLQQRLGLSYPFSGAGSLRKEGSGTLTLSGQNSYGGITYIDAGTLRVTATNVLPAGPQRGGDDRRRRDAGD